MHACAILGRHHAALTEPRRERKKISRVTKITKYVEEYKIKRKPNNTLAGVVDVKLRNERNYPRKEVSPEMKKVSERQLYKERQRERGSVQAPHQPIVCDR